MGDGKQTPTIHHRELDVITDKKTGVAHVSTYSTHTA
jgi:hypothetical protein